MDEYDWHKEIGSQIAFDLSEGDEFEIELRDGRTIGLAVVEKHTILNDETEVICRPTDDGRTDDWAVYANPMEDSFEERPRYDVYAVNLDVDEDSDQIEILRV